MRFNLRFLLLYVMPSVAYAGAVWNLSNENLPAASLPTPVVLLLKCAMSVLLAGWWVLAVRAGTAVFRSLRQKRLTIRFNLGIVLLFIVPLVAICSWIAGSPIPDRYSIIAVVLLLVVDAWARTRGQGSN